MVAGPRERSQVIPDRAEVRKRIGRGPGGRVVVRVGDDRSGDRSGDEPRAVPQAKEPVPRSRRIKAVAKRRPPRLERYTIPKPATSDAGSGEGNGPPNDRPTPGMPLPDEPERNPEIREESDRGEDRFPNVRLPHDSDVGRLREMHPRQEETGAWAERIVKKVRARNIHAKLPEGARVGKDKKLTDNVGGYYDHGPDKPNPWRVPKYSGAVEGLINTASSSPGEFEDLMNLHVVSTHPYEKDPGIEQVRISFFQDPSQVDSRGKITPAYVTADLPSEAVTELFGGIVADPDRLEEFYQKAFPGLDRDAESPGMRRIPADGFILLSGERIKEAGAIRSYDSEGIRRYFDNSVRYRYKNGPYGTGDAIEAK